MALTPLLTATPNDPPTYSQGMAETFSWVPMEGAGRPLFARATYLANASDFSISLSSGDLNVNMADVEGLVRQLVTKVDALTGAQRSVLGQAGFDFIVGGQTANNGPYSTVQVVSAARVFAISAANTNVRTLTAFDLPANFSFNGPIQSITLGYGAAIVYKL
jgi:hypothetical protein